MCEQQAVIYIKFEIILHMIYPENTFCVLINRPKSMITIYCL